MSKQLLGMVTAPASLPTLVSRATCEEPLPPPCDPLLAPPIANHVGAHLTSLVIPTIPLPPLQVSPAIEVLNSAELKITPVIRVLEFGGAVGKAYPGNRPVRQWLVARWRHTPAWLASLVVHLTFMILCGTIMFPYGNQQVTHLLMVLMNGENVENVEEFDSHSITLTPSQQFVESSQLGERDGANPADPAELLAHSEFDATSPPAPPALMDGLDRLVSAPAATESEHGAPPRDVEQTLLGRKSPLDAEARIAEATTTQDTVVERFIEFDIGRLQGEEGARARRDFDSLGVESLSALVKGFNRSAYISASCPVRVLESKLNYVLSQTNDPTSLQYVLDNVGKGVAADAVHAQILQKFRTALRKRVFGEEFIRDALRERGTPSMEYLSSSIQELSATAPDQLNEALRSEQLDRRLAAVIAISLRDTVGVMPPGQRADLAKRLIGLLADPDEPMRTETHRALLTLSFEDVRGNPDSQLVLSDPERAAKQWSIAWEKFSQSHRLDARAASALKIADSARKSRQTKTATAKYRQIISEFPGTTAASEAQDRLDGKPAPAPVTNSNSRRR